MPEQCCGKERTTTFCPDCGKQMKHEPPLHELRKYCRERQEKAVASLSKHKIESEEMLKRKNGDTLDYDVRRTVRVVENDEKTVLKWDRWIDALDAILSPQEEKTDE